MGSKKRRSKEEKNKEDATTPVVSSAEGKRNSTKTPSVTTTTKKDKKEERKSSKKKSAIDETIPKETTANANNNNLFQVGSLSKRLFQLQSDNDGDDAQKQKNSALSGLFASAEEKSKKAWEEVKSTRQLISSVIKSRSTTPTTTTTSSSTTRNDASGATTKKRTGLGKNAKKRQREADNDEHGDSDEESFDVYRHEPELRDLVPQGSDDENDSADDREDEDAIAQMKEDGKVDQEMDEEEDEEDDNKEKKKGEKTGEKKEIDKEAEKEKNERTIFIGNIPVSMTKKELKRLLLRSIELGEARLALGGSISAEGGAEKGTKRKVESIRFRSVPFSKQNTPRKFAFANQEFHPERDSMNAYAVLDSIQTAKCACAGGNNMIINDKHIRMDMATNKSHETRFSVFVGNLPFDVEDEKVRSHFQQCGDIKSVRLIRDKATNLGKGIGYIAFNNYEGFKKGIAMDGSQFLNRKLRVQRVERETKTMLSRTAFHKNGGKANPENNKREMKGRNNRNNNSSGGGGRSWEGQRVDANQARRQLKKSKVRKEIRKTKKKEEKANPKTHKKQKTQ